MGISRYGGSRHRLRGYILTTAVAFGLLAGTGYPNAAVPASTNTVQAAPAPLQEADIAPQTLITGRDEPWAMDYAPDGRIFINERPGQIRVVENGRLLPDPWLKISRVVQQGESGLLGIDLDPDFKNNGFLGKTQSAIEARQKNYLKTGGKVRLLYPDLPSRFQSVPRSHHSLTFEKVSSNSHPVN